jgi:hypothetical protein
MVTARVIEIQRLSVHRSDIPVPRWQVTVDRREVRPSGRSRDI